MGSSSDESFVWTKASTGSDDSDEINYDEREDEIKLHDKKHYKQEVLDSSNESKQGMQPHKKKNNKDSSDIEDVSPNKKRIKCEPGSDSDSVKIKKKKKNKEISNGSLDDSFTYEDKYLNMRVKQERELNESASLEKSKKNKKQQSNHKKSIDHNEIATVTNGSILNEKKSNKKKKKIKENSFTTEELFDVQEQSHRSEKDPIKLSHKSQKKKKSEAKSLSESSDKIDEKINIADGTLKKTSKQTKCSTTSVENHNVFTSEENTEVNSKLPKAKYSDNFKSGDSETNDNNDYARNKKSIVKSVTQKTPRLSDRIKFEDEIESDSHSACQNTTFQNIEEDSSSSHLKIFLKENYTLQSISNSSNKNAGITDEDEIWILKCPHDVDINKLSNTDINLDNKCKIKINGETYCGNLDDSVEINVISSSKNDFKIKKMVANGIIHFRKRLPKPHFHEDNVIVNNQSDFIPLPATKCRHPLFGSNYKDAINSIDRLQSSSQDFNALNSAVKKKKKIHKEIECQKPKVEYDSESSFQKAKEEFDQDTKVKKAKKRKHSKSNDHIGEKTKKKKLEPDSAEAWASEKAIEENLFSF